MITADQALVKQINKAIVLNSVRKSDSISRIEIAKDTGLNKSTVSALVDELIADNLILEIGTGASIGGRKPVILTINKNACSIIGIDMGVNYILSVLTNFAGEILWERKITICAADGQEVVINQLLELIEDTVRQAPATAKGILGIGIGFPGIVNYEKGLVLVAPNLGWENVLLKKIIEEKFSLPVFIDNEANTGALGEKWFGHGKNASNFVYVSAGMGIGAGIIINEKLYRGTYGLAGEMGHMTIDIDGHVCTCGNHGCWEVYASEQALFRCLQEKTGKAWEHDIDSIMAAAKMGNGQVLAALKYVGNNLGIGIANLTNTFNPKIVIIGNTLGLASPYYINELSNAVWERCFSAKYFAIRILPSALHGYACAIGAASLVISRVYDSPSV